MQPAILLASFCPPEECTQRQQAVNAFKGDLRVEEKDDHILLRDKSWQARVLLVPYSVPSAKG